MRRRPDETLRAPRDLVVIGGGRRGTRCPATAAAVRAATAAATIKRERAVALAVAVDGAFVRRQGCRRLALALFHRRGRSRLPVLGGAAVALATTATTPGRDDLATILSHRSLSQIRALSTEG